MSIANYQSAANWANLESLVGSEGQRFVKIYNNTGSALSNGAVKILSYLVDATDTSNPIIKGIPVAPSQNAGATNIVIVIDNSPKDLATIADATYGWACVEGYTTALVHGGTAVAVGDGLIILASGTAFTKSTSASSGAGVIPTTIVSATAMEAYAVAANALKKVCLRGIPTSIA